MVARRKGTGGWWGDSPQCSRLPACACASPRMLCCGVLALLLSWTSLAADTTAAVVSSGLGGGGWSDQDCLSGGLSMCCAQSPQGRASFWSLSLT